MPSSVEKREIMWKEVLRYVAECCHVDGELDRELQATSLLLIAEGCAMFVSTMAITVVSGSSRARLIRDMRALLGRLELPR